MTSAMTTAAAYEAWLGIPAAQHPPHYYALLGLPPLAANEQAILQAYQQRAMLVGQQLGGPQGDIARRLLAELAAAQACLLDAHARAAYDRWLSERLGPAAKTNANRASAAGLSRPSPRSASAPPVVAAAKSDEVTPPPYITGEAPPTALPWIIAGVCAGLLAVAVLGVAMFGLQRQQRSQEASAANAIKSQRDAEDRKRQPDRLTRNVASKSGANATEIAKLDRDDDVLGQRVAPLTTKPELLHPDASVVGPPDASSEIDVSVSVDDDEDGVAKTSTSDETPKPDPGSSSPETTPTASEPKTAAPKLPRSFALPSRTNNDAQGLLAQLPVKDQSTVTLKLDTVGLPGGGKYQLQNAVEGLAAGERMWPVQYTGADGITRAVGEYTLADGELGFRWAESAQSIDEALGNSGLKVSFDDQTVTVNQRSPDAVAPLKLAVDVGAITTAEKLQSPPPQAKLYLALDGQSDAFPTHQLQPAEPVVAGQEIDVIFGEATDPYRLALRVSLVENGVGGIRLEARPMFQAVDEGQKWDYFRPKSVLQTLAQLKQQESLLDARLQQLQQRFGRNAAQLQQATELYNRQATELQTRILVLEKVHALCEELNASGALNYRVFAKLGEREVDLVDSSLGITIPVATPAKPPADDASAIVGPPTDPAAPAPKDEPEAE